MRIGFLSHLDLNLYLFRLPIMKRLVDRGDEVYAIAPREEYLDRFEEYGIKTISYKIDRGSLNPAKELQAIQEIYQALKPLRLDLLHTFTIKPNIYGTFAAKRAGVSKVINLVEGLGSFYVEDGFKSKLVRYVMEKLYKKAFAKSDRVIFVNSDDPRYMVQRGIIDPDKVKIIKSVGIDTREFDPATVKKRSFQTDKPVVMMVARAIWHKGVREFYEMAKALHHKAHFVYVGGTYEDNPSAVPLSFLRSPYVEYLGHRDDVKELVNSCDIFVLPSYREGLPRTLLEAASLAKPLVATDVVGCKDVVVDGVNGYLVPPKDIKQLSQKVQALIDDPTLRQKFGQRARSLCIEEFDIEKIVDRYIELYDEVLGV